MSKKETAERAEPVTAVENTAEPKYRLDKLRENCYQIFGVDASTFAGATASLPEDGEYSVGEIKSIIERWSAKEAN